MQKKSLLANFYVKTFPPAQPPYQVDEEKYQRFDQRNNLTVGRPNWDETVQVFSRKSVDTRVKKIKGGKPGYQVEDYSLFLAGGVTTFRMGNSINHSNRGEHLGIHSAINFPQESISGREQRKKPPGWLNE